MNCRRSAFLKARKSEAERPARCALILRVPFGKHFRKRARENRRAGLDGDGDTAIASLRGVPAERSDKKCTLRGQRRRQLYLSRREISPPSRLRANGGVGRTSGSLFSVIKRSQKPQGGKRGERRKVFRGAVSRRTIRSDKSFRADTFGQKNSFF